MDAQTPAADVEGMIRQLQAFASTGWPGVGQMPHGHASVRSADVDPLSPSTGDEPHATGSGESGQAIPGKTRGRAAKKSGDEEHSVKKRSHAATKHQSAAKPSSAPTLTEMTRQLEDELQEKLAAIELLEEQREFLHSRVGMLELMIAARDDQVQRLRLVEQGGSPEELRTSLISLQEMKIMHVSGIAKRIKTQIQKLGQALVTSGRVGDTQEVSRLVRETLTSRKYSRLMRADTMLLSGRNLNELSDGKTTDLDEAPEGHWAQVVDKMALEPAQLRLIWLLHDAYCRWYAPLAAERAVLTQVLKQVTAETLPGPVSAPDVAREDVAYCAVLSAMHQNIVKERCLIVLVSEVLFNTILSEIQVARMMVHSYPFFMNEPALLAAAAVLHAPPDPAQPVPQPVAALQLAQACASAARQRGPAAHPGSVPSAARTANGDGLASGSHALPGAGAAHSALMGSSAPPDSLGAGMEAMVSAGRTLSNELLAQLMQELAQDSGADPWAAPGGMQGRR